MVSFFRSRVELWAALLVGLLLLAPVLAVFGGVVLAVERGTPRLGVPGAVAHAVASVPENIREILKSGERMQAFTPRRFADRPPGWTFAPGAAVPGYLLLSRFDGPSNRHRVELVRLGDGSVLHVWEPDADALLRDARRVSVHADPGKWTKALWRAIHPAPAADGGLVVKDHFGPLIKIDACGNPVWMNDSVPFHHSTESDGAGGFWVGLTVDPAAIPGVSADFLDDGIAHVDAAGRIVWQKSVTEILLDNGFEHEIFPPEAFIDDPVHLNDVEPVLADGPYWKRGDLFLSLREPSMILLYRPATGKVVWQRQGPWIGQHDVDILSPGTIGIFNNDVNNRGKGPYVDGTSGIMVHDFRTGEVTEPWKAALDREDMRTFYEGLFTVLPDGTLFVEEENGGRILFIGPDGTKAAEFINTDAAGTAWHLGWSRWLPEADGAALAARLLDTDCPGGATTR